METLTLAAIEAKRQEMRIPIDRLCAAAGLTSRGYLLAKSRKTPAEPATLAKLSIALRRFQRGFAVEAQDIAPHGALKACIVVAAAFMRRDPKAVLASDPSRRATANPEWQKAAEVRRVGYFIANQFLGFPAADLARAYGVTRQSVSDAVSELEWERDREGGNNQELDELLSKLEEMFA